MKKLISLILALCPTLVFAQEESDSLYREIDLNQVVVTGTRTPKLLKDTPIQTRVISLKDIQKVDATNVQDLLQQEMPGVEFSYAMNQQVHMNLSGFGGQGVLFLVDGERLAGETMDDVDFTRLNMNNVQRIEIVKGAASALYGSNAGGGVINIITKDATDPFALNLNARYAPRHNEQRYGGSLSLANSHWSNLISGNFTGVDNYDVHSADNPQTRIVSTIYGDKTCNFKDQVTWRPLSGMKISGKAGYFYRTLSRNADTPERYRDFTGGLHGIWKISEADNIDLSYSFDQYDKSDYQRITSLDIRDYSNVQNSIRGVYNHSFGSDILTVGGDYMHDYLMNNNLDRTHEQDTYDIFAQYDYIANRHWELVGALRYDYFSERKNSRVTPKLTACYKNLRHLVVRFGYGMGFRAPTLKEMYYNFDMAGIWIVQGNSDLKPEVSHNFTGSAEWTQGHYNFTASVYYNKVENKLTTGVPYYKQGNTQQPYLDYTNLDHFRVYGGELSAQARWNNGFSAKLSYAYTKERLAKDKDGNAINNQYIPARNHSFTGRVDWDKQISKNYGLNISLNGRVLSSVENVEFIDYYDISKGTQNINYPAYTLWKLMATNRIGRKVKVTLTIDNLLNYRPKYYYLNCPLTDGTNAMVGVNIDI